jgi:isoleucyl-tRNA synthetase
MEIARKAVELGRAARKDSKLKVRQPLSRLVALGLSEPEKAMLRELESIVLDEINVKRLDFDKNEAAYYALKADPDFKSIGPKFGPRAGEIAGKIKKLTTPEIQKLMGDGHLALAGDSGVAGLATEDVRIKVVPEPGFSVGADGHLKIALDLKLDEELIAEGTARELINKIQNLRKTAGLEVTDRIVLRISLNSETSAALERFSDYIKRETLAQTMNDERELHDSQEFDLNGVKTIIALERI